jgi:hypothetical protein
MSNVGRNEVYAGIQKPENNGFHVDISKERLARQVAVGRLSVGHAAPNILK